MLLHYWFSGYNHIAAKLYTGSFFGLYDNVLVSHWVYCSRDHNMVITMQWLPLGESTKSMNWRIKLEAEGRKLNINVEQMFDQNYQDDCITGTLKFSAASLGLENELGFPKCHWLNKPD